MSAPFGGPPALPFDTADAPQRRGAALRPTDLRRTGGAEAAAQALPAVLLDARGQREHVARPQGVHAFLRAYYHMKSADWKQNQPASARGQDRRRVGKAAALLRDGSGQGDGGDRRAGNAVSGRDRRVQVAARRRAARCTATEYGRTGFQGGLRATASDRAADTPPSCRCFRPHDRRAVHVHRRQERLGSLSEPRRARAECRRSPARRCGHASGRRRRTLGAAGAAGSGEQVAPAISPYVMSGFRPDLVPSVAESTHEEARSHPPRRRLRVVRPSGHRHQGAERSVGC